MTPLRPALLALCCGITAAAAEPLRDPMLPPAASRATAPAGDTIVPTPSGPVLRQILVVDGRRYAVEGTRLRGVGDRFAGARIERIGDDAIWLREGAQLRRVPLFAGITRQAAAEPAGPASATHRSSPAPALARATRLRSPDTP